MTSKGTFPLVLAVALGRARAGGGADRPAAAPRDQPRAGRCASSRTCLPSARTSTLTAPVTAGRIEMTPWRGRGVPGGSRAYDLIRASAVIAPFTLHASCDGPDQSREYDEVGVQLGDRRAVHGGALGGDVYQVTIPNELVRVYEAAIADDGLETRLQTSAGRRHRHHRLPGRHGADAGGAGHEDPHRPVHPVRDLRGRRLLSAR